MTDTKRSASQFGRRLKGYFSWPDGLGIRLGIVIAFVLFLAAFIHTRGVRVTFLEPGSVADKYVVAQTDFDFPDDEAWIRLKEKSVRNVGSIYWISKSQIDEAKQYYDQHWMSDSKIGRSQLGEYHQAGEIFAGALLEERFTDSKTLAKVKEAGVPVARFSTLNLTDGIEEVLPLSFWDSFRHTAFAGQGFSDEAEEYVLNYFKGISWKFGQDRELENVVRSSLQASVPKKMTRVRAGSRLIEKGEKVTGRHATMLQSMKHELEKNRKRWHLKTFLGSCILASLFVLSIYIFLRLRASSILLSSKKLLLYGVVLALALVFGKATEYFLIEHPSHLIETAHYPLFVPFAVILLCVLLDMGTAIFTTLLLAVVFSVTMPVDTHRFLIVNLVGSMFCLFNVRSVRKRTEIFWMCAKAWFACAFVVIGVNFTNDIFWGATTAHELTSVGIFMGLTAILCIGVLPLLESLFQIMTDITLMEFLDPNNELLRKLSIEAPGTYQHTLLLANLAEAAAVSIGAKGTFCRVATMYHDIGKIVNPQYFTENQQGGLNMHQLLTPTESAAVIIGHVSEGERLAREHNLPQSFINIIREHHGTTLVYYFYRKELQRQGGDESAVNERDFRYPGPKPRTKESAIIMIADMIEAAVHSLDEFTEEEITDLVTRLINQRAEDGQLDYCQLTFEELSTVRKTLIKNLVLSGHSRVVYPKAPEKKVSEPVE